MAFNIKMFDSRVNVVVVRSEGYGSIVTHSHDFAEIGFILNGTAENRIEEKKILLKKGDMFIIADRNVSHSIFPCGEASDFVIINIIFPFDFFNFNYSLFNPEYVYKAGIIKDAESLIERIIYEYEAKNWLYEDVTAGLTRVLVTELLRNTPTRLKRQESDGTKQKQLLSYIDTAISFIHKNYDKQIDVDDVALACGVCKAYLQRLFRKERDTSIKEYLIKYRIEQSCKYLLNTEFPVASIAEMVGFNDIKYFYLKFKEIVKDTPNHYKQVRGDTENDND